MNPDQLEKLGELADKADSYAELSKLPMPCEMRLKAIADGMLSIARGLKLLRISIDGENPWEGGPFDPAS